MDVGRMGSLHTTTCCFMMFSSLVLYSSVQWSSSGGRCTAALYVCCVCTYIRIMFTHTLNAIKCN